MKNIDIRDVGSFKYGHYTNEEGGTGTTVIIHEHGAVGGVSVQGKAPGTRETDVLRSENTVQEIHAVTLSGGSAFGLDAAGGVMRYLEERNIGFEVMDHRVPVVPAAILFDFFPEKPAIYPDLSYGYEAAKEAFAESPFSSGNYGAGTGASIGKISGFPYAMKGGIGVYAVESDGVKVGACIAVNAFGDIIDPNTNRIIAGAYEKGTGFLDTERILRNSPALEQTPEGNTTIGCITTNARLHKSEANQLAASAHDGLARSIRPVHTPMDGDALFVMSEGEVEAPLVSLTSLAVYAIEQAVTDAVKHAHTAYGLTAYHDIE
ncbi:P1 family peptidase [Salimicrobium halophilum]|uniref:L-aminopeptidase/D-esterase n=1 Tax=Salimicrobium halophilum TaxID=86666 RepID=A0A1G8Q4D1_9BACI|nr:P1 family peptidase [Salimicrobium halophilum]SDI99386.1 L-aminopeptidase/D-esterase [Salimicrobium halophilum]